jgi:hypothetical protein
MQAESCSLVLTTMRWKDRVIPRRAWYGRAWKLVLRRAYTRNKTGTCPNIGIHPPVFGGESMIACSKSVVLHVPWRSAIGMVFGYCGSLSLYMVESVTVDANALWRRLSL